MINKHFVLSAFFAVSALTLAVSEALAQTAEPVTTLEQVLVTATRGERSVVDIPVSASVIGREQIEATPAQSLDDVLRTVPSLNLTTSASYQQHPTSNEISIRGLGSNRALVLLDGVPLNHPFSGFVQWMRIPMETVERVEVVRGGGSSLWGNYAMGGVINIITRVPKRTELAIDAGAGSYGTRRLNVYGALVTSDAMNWDINFNSFDTDGYNRTPEELRTALDVPVEFHARNLQLAGHFRVDPTLTGYTRINLHSNHQVLGTALGKNRQDEIDLAGGLTKKLGAGSDLTATAFYTNSRFRTDNTTPDETRSSEFVSNLHRTPVHDYGGSLQWTTRLGAAVPTVVLGADYHLIDGEDQAAIFDTADVQSRTDIGRGKQRLVGVFAQASVLPVDKLEVLASAREERIRNFDGFDGNPGGRGPVPDRTDSAFSPRLSTRYELSDEWALRAAAYKAFRTPNLDSLYRSFAANGFVALPNSALKPERLRGAELGFDFITPQIRTQVTAFYNQIRDLITSRSLSFAETPPGFFFAQQNINAGRSRSRGIEAEADWRLDARWSVQAGFARILAEITENSADPSSVGQQLKGQPKNRLSASALYKGNGFKSGARIRYASRHSSSTGLYEDAYTIVDWSGSLDLSKNFELFANVENLLDRRYIGENTGFAPPQLGTPRSLSVGVRARFK